MTQLRRAAFKSERLAQWLCRGEHSMNFAVRQAGGPGARDRGDHCLFRDAPLDRRLGNAAQPSGRPPPSVQGLHYSMNRPDATAALARPSLEGHNDRRPS